MQGDLILAGGLVRSKKQKVEKKKHENFHPRRRHHECHSPATVTNSIQRATKHVQSVSPYSFASIGPAVEEIGLAQVTQSVKTTNVTSTHRQTDEQTN